SLKALFLPAFLWTLIAGTSTYLILFFAGQIEPGYEWFVLIAGILQGLFTTNQQIILGFNNIRLYNFTQIFVNFLILGALAYLMFVEESRDVADYFLAYVLAHVINWLIGMIYIFPRITWTDMLEFSVVRKLFGFGLTIQTGTFAQQLNNRFAFYVLV